MQSANKKVRRMLYALAIVLKDCEDEVIIRAADVIADEQDGYCYDFVSMVDNARSFIADGKRVAVNRGHDYNA